MGKFADLHIHTYYSDGLLSPEEILRKASDCKLSAISITDHDSVDGCREAMPMAKLYSLDIISGVEFSCYFDNREIHILGYAFDIDNKQIQYHLSEFRKARLKRAERIHEKLDRLGIVFPFDLIIDKAGAAPITRPHIAAALIQIGAIDNQREAFTKYIGEGCPAYEQKANFLPEKAINLINQAGGVAVLAHPGNSIEQPILYKLIKSGLDGIEVVHPMHTNDHQKMYTSLASQYWLLTTGGSDYHGSREYDESNFGKYVVPYSAVESLRYRISAK